MHCPDCRGTWLKINVVFAGTVSCRFHSDAGFELCEAAQLDAHWHDDSECHCLTCGWDGYVWQATSSRGDRQAPCSAAS
jgi:hypothetical protein